MGVSSGMSKNEKLKERAVKEAKSFSLFVSYAWVLFCLFDLHKWMVLRKYHITHDLGVRVGIDLISAVVLGKVVFIAEELHIADHLKDRPLVQPILYKSAVFSLILICFQIVEEILLGKRCLDFQGERLGGDGEACPVTAECLFLTERQRGSGTCRHIQRDVRVRRGRGSRAFPFSILRRRPLLPRPF